MADQNTNNEVDCYCADCVICRRYWDHGVLFAQAAAPCRSTSLVPRTRDPTLAPNHVKPPNPMTPEELRSVKAIIQECFRIGLEPSSICEAVQRKGNQLYDVCLVAYQLMTDVIDAAAARVNRLGEKFWIWTRLRQKKVLLTALDKAAKFANLVVVAFQQGFKREKLCASFSVKDINNVSNIIRLSKALKRASPQISFTLQARIRASHLGRALLYKGIKTGMDAKDLMKASVERNIEPELMVLLTEEAKTWNNLEGVQLEAKEDLVSQVRSLADIEVKKLEGERFKRLVSHRGQNIRGFAETQLLSRGMSVYVPPSPNMPYEEAKSELKQIVSNATAILTHDQRMRLIELVMLLDMTTATLGKETLLEEKVVARLISLLYPSQKGQLACAEQLEMLELLIQFCPSKDALETVKKLRYLQKLISALDYQNAGNPASSAITMPDDWALADQRTRVLASLHMIEYPDPKGTFVLHGAEMLIQFSREKQGLHGRWQLTHNNLENLTQLFRSQSVNSTLRRFPADLKAALELIDNIANGSITMVSQAVQTAVERLAYLGTIPVESSDEQRELLHPMPSNIYLLGMQSGRVQDPVPPHDDQQGASARHLTLMEVRTSSLDLPRASSSMSVDHSRASSTISNSSLDPPRASSSQSSSSAGPNPVLAPPDFSGTPNSMSTSSHTLEPPGASSSQSSSSSEQNPGPASRASSSMSNSSLDHSGAPSSQSSSLSEQNPGPASRASSSTSSSEVSLTPTDFQELMGTDPCPDDINQGSVFDDSQARGHEQASESDGAEEESEMEQED